MAPRFPRIVLARKDKVAEETNMLDDIHELFVRLSSRTDPPLSRARHLPPLGAA
jgi:hypothetical protein